MHYRPQLNTIICILMLIVLTPSASGQLPPGAMAPDFELVDINGQTHHLYEYLDEGKTVFLDFSTTWCVPCWQYHETHVFNDVYELYGPTGSDQVMVLLIECDESTDIDDIMGLTAESLGDWTEGTNFPIIDDIDDLSDSSGNSYTMGLYEVPAYPSFYQICPNRQAYHHYANDLSDVESYLDYFESCIVAQEGTAASALFFEHLDLTCSPEVDLELVFQNSGVETLTEASVELFKDGEFFESIDWEGELLTYETGTVVFDNVQHGEGEYEYEVIISAEGDQDDTDNSLSGSIFSGIDFISQNVVTLTFSTDQFPEELGWRLLNNEGQLIQSSELYEIENGYSIDINLGTEPDCFVLEITDIYGDGLLVGGYTLVNTSDESILLDIPADEFNSNLNIHPFGTEGFGNSVDDLAVEYRVYPTFASEIIHVHQSNNKPTSLILRNGLGQIIESRIIQNKRTALHVAKLPSGSYYIQLGQGVSSSTFKVFIN